MSTTKESRIVFDQDSLDQAIKDGVATIVLQPGLTYEVNASADVIGIKDTGIIARGNTQIHAFYDCKVEAYDDVSVDAYQEANITLNDRAICGYYHDTVNIDQADPDINKIFKLELPEGVDE